MYQAVKGLQYSPVPEGNEDDDVTSLNKAGSTKKSTKINSFIIFASSLVIITLIAALTWKYDTLNVIENPISLYQTSPAQSLSMTPLTTERVKELGFVIGALNFGNAKCTTAQQQESKCIPPTRRTSKIRIDSLTKYQNIVGFGGAFTQASAFNFYKLPKEVRDRVIQLYFGANGIGLTLGRIHINSCDFSTSSYSFDEVPGDVELLHFDNAVTQDQTELLPFIRAAAAASAHPIRLLASPWSPPAWMKVPSEVL